MGWPRPRESSLSRVRRRGRDRVSRRCPAAGLFGLLSAREEDVDVTVVGCNLGSRRGIRLHRVAQIDPLDVVTVRGLRVTSVARTVCDLAATESPRECEGAFQEALYRRRDVDRRMEEVVARVPTRRGAPVIRALLHDPRLTRSERERRMLELIASAQLPRPLTNVRVHGYLLDVYWPAERLVVEFDGWGAHGHRLAFEADRKRDQILLRPV
jgi:hypothetical protein